MSYVDKKRNTLGFLAGAWMAVCPMTLALAGGLEDEPRQACAAWDLKLLSLIEQVGHQRTVQPERIFIVFQSALSARKLCDQGEFANAHDRYEALVEGLARRPH